MPRSKPSTPTEPPSPPWWRVGMVWLVIGGPLAVVIAGLVTAVIAAAGADDVLSDSERRASQPASTMPAMEARNHAASPKP